MSRRSSSATLGLRGTDIPLAARIVSIADAWDSLISGSAHEAPWSADRATDFIRSQSGKQFDPAIVALLLQLMAEPQWAGARVVI